MWWVVAGVVWAGGAAQQDDWSLCPSICKCKWVSGRKTAECRLSGLNSVPSTLSPEIQSVDLSSNPFHSLPSEAFKNVGLINLQKIYLKDCSIQELHKDAFKGLLILIELDLSENQIHVLHPGTFRDNIRLRLLIVNKNPIQKLEDGLFTNLTFLQTVEMSYCELSHISYKTFNNVPNLQHLALDGNNLSHMKLSAVENLTKLRSLVLHNNPWRCDCHLKALRDWAIGRNLYAQPTSCAEPLQLQSRMWNEIPSEVFACKPQISWPPPGTSVTAEGDRVTLSCRVTGNPPPDVYWVFNSRIIANNTRTVYGDVRYTIGSNGGDSNRWVNLTVNRVRTQDRGEFTCVAKSAGGVDERNMTLVVRAGRSSGGAAVGDSWPLIIGLITGLAALFIVVVILCCCFCRRRERRQGKKAAGNGLSPNGDVGHHIGASAEQEKSLLTIPNPIQKPPRRYEAQPSPAPQLSELNRKLLDEGPLIAPSGGGEEEQSLESRATTPQRSRDKLDVETLPPDLIAFPGRGVNTSPAGSCASTAMDVSRAPQSPVHSPLYHGFGTLPYSRSQSPFSPVSAVVLPRPGYVTIPRRPRVPSWSSAPTPTLLEDPLSPIRAEPIYDNLGPRTTVDGSSVLSLNKAVRGEERGILRPLPVDRRWPITPLKRAGSADGPISTSTPRSKVAPKPPPKPKKNGPLYEDEGEDGTEV